MKLLASYKSQAAAVAATALLLGFASVAAKTPGDVADLVGARGAGGETELGNRGYTYVTMTHGVQYWWNVESKACVGIKVAEGRYKSVSAANASDCHQSAKAESSAPRQATSAAETACMTAVNGNYGGKVDDLKVIRSEYSEANSEVVLDAVGVRGGPTTERWRCLSSNSGKVEDLRVVE